MIAKMSVRNGRMMARSRRNAIFLKQLGRYKALYLLMLPGILYLIINNYLPMVGMTIAFKSVNFSKGFLGGNWIGLKNFEYLFHSSTALEITRNTLLYNVAFILINLVISVGLAILINEVRQRRLVKFYQSSVLLPYFISMVIVAYLTESLLNSDVGFINKSLLAPLGIKPVKWYMEQKYWPFILVIVNAWKNVGYLSIVYTSAILGIDSDIYEAATIDGATRFQKATKITIPLLVPIIVTMTFLAVGRIFYSDFGLFYQVPMNSGALLPVTNVIDTYVYRGLMQLGDLGMSSAAGVYQSFVGFVMILLANLLVRKISPENALF